MTNLLAVETSGFEGSLAFLSDGVVKDERSLAVEGRRNAQTLVTEASRLLTDHKLQPADVTAVAVSYGPGSFTGLRVGITFAKTFCWANDAKLISVDTHRALAHRVECAEKLVTVVSDAQRGELFVSEYSIEDSDSRKIVKEVRIETIEELTGRSQQSVGIVTGPGLDKHHEAVSKVQRTTPIELWQTSAGTVADVGYGQYLAEDFADMYELEPLYIRRSYAEEKATTK